MLALWIASAAHAKFHVYTRVTLMSLNVIEKVTGSCEKHFQRAAFAPSDHSTARPLILHTKSVGRGESHSHLSLTVSSRLFLLQVVNFPLLHRLAAALME